MLVCSHLLHLTTLLTCSRTTRRYSLYPPAITAAPNLPVIVTFSLDRNYDVYSTPDLTEDGGHGPGALAAPPTVDQWSVVARLVRQVGQDVSAQVGADQTRSELPATFHLTVDCHSNPILGLACPRLLPCGHPVLVVERAHLHPLLVAEDGEVHGARHPVLFPLQRRPHVNNLVKLASLTGHLHSMARSSV